MYDNFFNNFFNSISSSWSRSLKEKDGYMIKEAKDHKGYIMCFNTLGVSPKDINVTFSPAAQTKYFDISNLRHSKSTFIRVCGSTKIPELDNQAFSVDYEAVFNSDFDIESVQYVVKDGLTLVYLKTKESTDNSTKAKCIEEGGTFSW